MDQEVDPGFAQIPKVLIVCDQSDTAPVWAYILRQQGLIVILESSVEQAVDRWSTEVPQLLIIDIDGARKDPLELCTAFRETSPAPLLLFLPTHHERQILEAYAAGVDEVVVKPVSPAIFLAKIQAWVRHSWIAPAEGLNHVRAGKHRLDLARRSLLNPARKETPLTSLEFRLLLLLMSRPAHIFSADEIIEAIWGDYGKGDQTMLKNVVYRLRQKIEADPHHPVLLQTGPGGYSFRG